MSTQTQLRRGTEAQCDAMIPAEGEFVIDMTNDRGRIGDGLRLGGWPVPNFSDIQDQSFVYAVATGTANALVLTIPIEAYSDGLAFEFKAPSNNTAAMTVDINGQGAIPLVKVTNNGISVMEADDIMSGVIYRAVVNNNQAQLTSSGFGQFLTAGSGIAISGDQIMINTDNAGGVGAYAMMRVNAAVVSIGGTVAGTNLQPVKFSSALGGGTVSATFGTAPTGTWRNMSGIILTGGEMGIFMRIA